MASASFPFVTILEILQSPPMETFWLPLVLFNVRAPTCTSPPVMLNVPLFMVIALSEAPAALKIPPFTFSVAPST